MSKLARGDLSPFWGDFISLYYSFIHSGHLIEYILCAGHSTRHWEKYQCKR